MLQDNVLIVIEPLETQTESGITLVRLETGARDRRIAKVLSVGPGYWTGCRHCGTSKTTFVPTELKPGDRVIVDATAGQDYSLDISVPRHNKSPEFQEVCGERGAFRIIREQEAHCIVVSEDEQAAA